MKRTASIAACILVVLAWIGAPVAALQAQVDTIRLTPPEVSACDLGGGCVAVPRLALAMHMRQLAEQAYEKGVEDGYRFGFEAGLNEARREKGLRL